MSAETPQVVKTIQVAHQLFTELVNATAVVFDKYHINPDNPIMPLALEYVNDHYRRISAIMKFHNDRVNASQPVGTKLDAGLNVSSYG